MREILFKAKRIDNGEWIIGNLVSSEDAEQGWEIIIIPKIDSNMFVKCGQEDLGFENWHIADKATVCQYTGLTDKNGNKIWENDVVFVTDDNGCSGQVDTGIGEIDFLEGLWYISGSVQNALYDINKCFQIEVIGNIFDNPELLSKTEC